MAEYMDVKTFANMAGISTQYVYRLLDDKLQPFCNKESGKTLISSDALNVLGVETPLPTVDKQLLEKLVDALQQQLSVKDEQIKLLQTELSAINASYRQLSESNVRLLDQQQQLNGMNMRLLSEPDQKTDDITPVPKEKKKWFQKKDKK